MDTLDDMPENVSEARRWVKRFWHQHMMNADSMFIAHLGNPSISKVFAEETQRIARMILPRGELQERSPIADDIKALVKLAGPRGCSERELRHASMRFRKLDTADRQAILTSLVESGLFVYQKQRRRGRGGANRVALVYITHAARNT